MKKHSIMITGSSGYIGSHLVPTIADASYSIVGLYRQTPPQEQINLYPVCVDLQNTNLLKAPLRGIETIVHLAWQGGLEGSIEGTDSTTRYADSRNLRDLRSLIQAANLEEVKKFVFVSAFGASRHSQSDFLREKYLAEVEILNSFAGEKAILRPTLVLDEKNESPYIDDLRKMAQESWFLPKFGDNHGFCPIGMNSLTSQLKKCIVDDASFGSSVRIVELRHEHETSINQAIQILGDKGRKKPNLFLPGKLGRKILDTRSKDGEKSFKGVIENFTQLDDTYYDRNSVTVDIDKNEHLFS